MNKAECESFLEKLLDAEGLEQAAALLNDVHAAHCSDCLDHAKQQLQLLQAINGVAFVAPPATVRQHFYQALHEAMGTAKPPVVVRRISFGWTVAAACLLLAVGTVFVYEWGNRNSPTVYYAKPLAVEQAAPVVSVSERVNGISTAAEEQAEDPKLLATLMDILERDKNPHVRMAAFYGLVKYKKMPEVHDRLVSILQSEQDPMIQVLLINVLTETRDPHALDAIRSIITNQKTRKEVKTLALSKI